MIHVETKNGKLICRMARESDDILTELVYGVASWFFNEFQNKKDFDPVKDKEGMINASAEAFGVLLRLTLENLYDRSMQDRNGGVLQ